MVEKEISKQTEIIIILSFGLSVIYMLTHMLVILLVILFLYAIATFSEPLTKKVVRFWMWFSELLGRINSTIALTLVFYLILSPIALLKKIVSRNSENNSKSNFKDLRRTYTAKDMENTW